MTRATLLMVLYLAAATVAGSNAATTPGLDAVPYRNLDDVRLAPGAQLAGYRAVMVERPSVTFAADWLKNMNARRERSRWLTAKDAQRIAEGFATDMMNTFAQAFRARG